MRHGNRLLRRPRLAELGPALLASLSAAAVLVTVTTTSGGDITVVVPNAYSCSQASDTCRQLNPPYAPSAPNQCSWVTQPIPGGVPADRVC